MPLDGRQFQVMLRDGLPKVPEIGPEAPERVRLARESAIVLDLMEDEFDFGIRWLRWDLPDGYGLCLMGALFQVRSRRMERDRAGVYLYHSIRLNLGESMKLTDFNDSRDDYVEVEIVIRTARSMALFVVEEYLEACRA
jgi:hypothetical protein